MNSLIIFVKAPVPGKVKTRMQPPLNEVQTALMYEAFVRDAVSGARLCGGAEVTVAYAPHPQRSDISWITEDALSWFAQADGDLGARLSAAFDRAFCSGAKKVVVIGSDCPDLEPELLRLAYTMLDDSPVVIGPARDGGYYLVGLRAPMPHLFTMMEWSRPDVLERTLERLRLRGDGYGLLPERSDIDNFDDLKALASRLAAGKTRAPHSRKAIHELIGSAAVLALIQPDSDGPV